MTQQAHMSASNIMRLPQPLALASPPSSDSVLLRAVSLRRVPFTNRYIKKKLLIYLLIKMKIPTHIEWNGFPRTIVKPDRINQESCAWIFADIKTDTWKVFEVANVGLEGKSVRQSFAPDKRQFAKIKRMARKEGLTKIGCVHTHIVEEDEEELPNQLRPSEADLKYARRFNDIVRCILVVFYPKRGAKGQIYGIVWFDQYGKILVRYIWLEPSYKQVDKKDRKY